MRDIKPWMIEFIAFEEFIKEELELLQKTQNKIELWTDSYLRIEDKITVNRHTLRKIDEWYNSKAQDERMDYDHEE